MLWRARTCAAELKDERGKGGNPSGAWSVKMWRGTGTAQRVAAAARAAGKHSLPDADVTFIWKKKKVAHRGVAVEVLRRCCAGWVVVLWTHTRIRPLQSFRCSCLSKQAWVYRGSGGVCVDTASKVSRARPS